MSAFSYKEMLTNQLIVFINQRIAQSPHMQEKVGKLSKDEVKKFQKKIVDSIINKAKGLADIQGTEYVGLVGNDGEKEMTSWVDVFFDEFEENMKEPEKAKTKVSTVTGATQVGKNLEFKIEEGMFGIEVKYDKKVVLSKEDFIKKISEKYKDKEHNYKWEDDKVTVVFEKARTKPKFKPKSEEIEEEEIEEEIEEIEEDDEMEEEMVEEVEEVETPKPKEKKKTTKKAPKKVKEEPKEEIEETEAEEAEEEEDGLF